MIWRHLRSTWSPITGTWHPPARLSVRRFTASDSAAAPRLQSSGLEDGRDLSPRSNHAGSKFTLLVQDLSVRIVNAITGELLRELALGLTEDRPPHTLLRKRPRANTRCYRRAMSRDIT